VTLDIKIPTPEEALASGLKLRQLEGEKQARKHLERIADALLAYAGGRLSVYQGETPSLEAAAIVHAAMASAGWQSVWRRGEHTSGGSWDLEPLQLPPHSAGPYR
jgi:hypothetical protein